MAGIHYPRYKECFGKGIDDEEKQLACVFCADYSECAEKRISDLDKHIKKVESDVRRLHKKPK